MVQTIEMIVMTKSSKYGAYCVAGFEVSDGRWVRLVSDDEETHGAVDDDMLYDAAAGRCADVLDRVRVEVEAAVPSPVQTENLLVQGTDRIHILGRATVEEAIRLHPFEERDSLFFSHHYIVQRDIGEIHHSLEFVRVSNLHIYTVVGSSGKPKHKADFECGGRLYTLFAMTDPNCYEKKETWLDSAGLALSISDDEWSRSNGHYIYVARIFDLSPRLRRRKTFSVDRKWIVRGMWTAAAAALAIAAGIRLSGMERVYIPKHTGARYHTDISCELMTNPKAAWEVPTIFGKILWKPCEVCLVKDRK